MKTLERKDYFRLPKKILVTVISENSEIRSFVFSRNWVLFLFMIPVFLLAGYFLLLIDSYFKYDQNIKTHAFENKRLENIIWSTKANIPLVEELITYTSNLMVQLSDEMPYEFDQELTNEIVTGRKVVEYNFSDEKAETLVKLVYESTRTIYDLSDYLINLAFKVQAVQSTLNHIEAIPDGLPVDGYLVSGFGIRKSPFSKVSQIHRGVDIVARINTSVKSGGDGTVSFAGTSSLWGKNVIIDHGFNVFSQYGHLNKIAVKEGQIVKKGDIIGALGVTGRTTGPHLHYQIWVNNTPLDPFLFIATEEQKNLKNYQVIQNEDNENTPVPVGSHR